MEDLPGFGRVFFSCKPKVYNSIPAFCLKSQPLVDDGTIDGRKVVKCLKSRASTRFHNPVAGTILRKQSRS